MKPIKGTSVSETEYNTIKGMLKRGMRPSAVRRASGRSESTVYAIVHADSFIEYKIETAKRLKNLNNRPKHVKPVGKLVDGKGYHNLTENEFKLIKDMLAFGITTSQVMKTTGRASSTLSFINRSDNLEQYKVMVNEARKPKLEVVKIEVNEPVDHNLGEISAFMSNINNSLTEINDTLKSIEEIQASNVRTARFLRGR